VTTLKTGTQKKAFLNNEAAFCWSASFRKPDLLPSSDKKHLTCWNP